VTDYPQLPLVSVLVTCFNRRDRIARAISSAQRQTYPRVEVVVADDASTDGSADLARSLLRPEDQLVVREVNGGQNAALNSALALATGDIIAFCDSDDELLPAFVERTVAPLLDDASLGFAYCRLVRGPAWHIEGCDQLGTALEQGHLSALGTLVVRRSALEPLLPLPERLVPGDMCQDDRISFELSRRDCFAHVPEELYRIIGAPDSVTKNDTAQIVGWDRLFTDYRDDVRELCPVGTLARHRVTNVERAVGAGDNVLALRLTLHYLAEAATGPRRARESSVLFRGSLASFVRLVGRWLRSRLARSRSSVR
jgi:glycosyltransferase involved in cell wall biosynthesis